jgi:hypothetical protein
MTRRQLFIYATPAVLAILFIGWFLQDNVFTDGFLSTHSLRRTEGRIEPLYDRLLLVRRESAGGPLLLKVLNEDIVVRYRFDTNRSEPVDSRAWHAATGTVAICQNSFQTQTEEEVGKYQTYGKFALNGAFSRSGGKLAVISAYGPKMPGISLFPGLGGGRNIWGQRYLEVKDGKPPYTNLRKTIRAADDGALCWSHEEDTVVYYEPNYFFRFSIFALDYTSGGEAASAIHSAFTGKDLPPDLSRLTGRFRDYGIDEDGDGLFEAIAIDIETETTVPGRYKIFLGLVSEGKEHVGGWAEAELNGGIETTTVRFDTSDWHQRGIEGEMTITSAQLDYGDDPNLENRENFGRTKKYSADPFKRKTTNRTGRTAE